MILLLVSIPAVLAACPTWDADFAARPAAGASSSTLTYQWKAAPTCDTFTFSHYRVCWNTGEIGSRPSAPATPDQAGATCDVRVASATRGRAWDRVDRSNHAFAARVFACEDNACKSWYGDADDSATLTDTSGRARTAKERWVIGGVADYADADRMIPDNMATAATGFFYPSIFPDAGRLAVWFSTGDGSNQNIRYLISKATGWGAWNDNGLSFHNPVQVAESTRGIGTFGWVTHPWVIPAVEGGVPFVRMFLQTDDDGDPNSGETFQIFSIDSSDAGGVDFDLACTEARCTADIGTCKNGAPCDWEDESADGGAASLEVAAHGDVFSSFLTSASHGQLLYNDDNGDGAVDFSAEQPSLLFTGAASACYEAPDDLFLGTWDGVGWDVPIDTNNCPERALEDAHDPSAITLLDGSTKVYMQVGPDAYQVCRYDGAMVDCEPIELAFDDGTPAGVVEQTLGGCSDNIQVFADLSGTRPRQGALLHVMGNGVDCFAKGGGGIVAMELRN